MKLFHKFTLSLTVVILSVYATVSIAVAQTDPVATPTPTYLSDRGDGVATSIAGTYVRRGELLVYPFYEYDRFNNFEYKPEEFGVVGNKDFRGKFRRHEGLIFLAYGITKNLAVEFEAATISATFNKSPLDTSAVPARIKESGLGDVETRLNWRWLEENKRHPEIFSYTSVVFPHNKNKNLIGTSGWEVNVGTGVTRGFKHGTVTVRGALSYSAASTSKFDLGELAVDYLKRLSPKWRLYLGVEGKLDEVSFIPELQWHLKRNVFIKFNSGVGLTPKAPRWAPEVGVLFTLGKH